MNRVRIISIIVLAGMLAGALALAFPGGVLAQGTNPPAPSAQNQQANQAARLEKVYQRELKALDAQAKRLTAADNRVQKLGERIANLKSQGKNTSTLEAALADFKAVLSNAHTTHDKAAGILKTHAGFDANGKVSDVQQARQTVQEAGNLLREVHRDLRPALGDLVRAVREFIRDNRGK